MKWPLTLTVLLMRFATLLASWMLRFGEAVSKDALPPPFVRILSKRGSIVRSSPAVIPTQWPPLVFQHTNTVKHSITWLLLESRNVTLDSRGWTGEENGEGIQMTFTLNFQEPARGPKPAAKN